MGKIIKIELLRQIPANIYSKVNSLRFLTGKASKRRFFDLKYSTTVQICLQNVLKRKITSPPILLSFPAKRYFYDFRLYLLQFYTFDFFVNLIRKSRFYMMFIKIMVIIFTKENTIQI